MFCEWVKYAFGVDGVGNLKSKYEIFDGGNFGVSWARWKEKDQWTFLAEGLLSIISGSWRKLASKIWHIQKWGFWRRIKKD